MFVRVSPVYVGRLVRVLLADVSEHKRKLASRALREKQWNDELRPDELSGYRPTMGQRVAALNDAIDLELAAIAPSLNGYLIPEAAVRKVLGDEFDESLP